MSEKVIVIAGATGDLGGRVAGELLQKGAHVRALVRVGGSSPRLESLRVQGAEIVSVNFANPESLASAVRDAGVVVSTLAGLRDVIVTTQSALLDAAVRAGVPRFIPSDFAIDFTKLPPGSNRNLNLREEFRERLEKAPIRATSILNGAFMDMLTGTAPFILFKFRRILCWGDPDQLMDWTTISDTAKYTAQAALDPDTPRFLRIAGEELSARRLQNLMTELTGTPYGLLRPGGLAIFKVLIQMTKTFTPDKGEIYPPWQGMQYMHNMYSGQPKFLSLDNARYPMKWTQARDVLSDFLKTTPRPSCGGERI